MTRRLLTTLVLVVGVSTVTHAQDSLTVVRSTLPTQEAPAENFTGTARVGERLLAQSPARVSGATVTFEPGARTHWHVHPLGQTLIITAGVGWVQHWGGRVQEVRPGDVVRIPPGVKHWHGASPAVSMTHVALLENPSEGPATIWMEPVTEDQYAGAPPSPADEQPSRAQQLMGDIAPDLAALTDDVLYGQVWANPALSQRDRSLATVSALIAMNRPDQLRSHLRIARANGVTEEELIQTITHLAFYAGWPNAVTAVGIARDVFEQVD